MLYKIVIASAVVGAHAASLCTDNGGSPCAKIASYQPPTDVTAHNDIDLDQKDLETALKVPDYTAAMAAYAEGGNSLKSSGIRTIKAFSKDLTGEPLFDQFKAYYGDNTYGDKWVSGALTSTATGFTSGRGDADFSTVNDASTIEQAVKKGTVQMIIWPYAVHELESAIGKCGTDQVGSLHYLDEGVAFYTGSLVGTDASGDTGGKLLYAVAESRCKDFNTCGTAGAYSTSGLAEANAKVFEGFEAMKTAIEADSCSGLRAMVDEITNMGYITIIQGALKYAWFVEEDRATSSEDLIKHQAEAATFAAALLPRLHTCSATDAATVYSNMKIGSTKMNFKAVKTAIENNYACMGVTCAQIGGYMKDDAYKSGFSASCGGEYAVRSSSSDGLATGALIGIIAGGVVGIGAIALVLKMFVFKGAAGAPATKSPV